MSFLPAADKDYIRKLARCHVPLDEIAVLMEVDEETVARIIAAGADTMLEDGYTANGNDFR